MKCQWFNDPFLQEILEKHLFKIQANKYNKSEMDKLLLINIIACLLQVIGSTGTHNYKTLQCTRRKEDKIN